MSEVRFNWSLDATSQLVVRELMRRGPMSRAELSRHLGFSGPTLSRIAKPLLEQGMLAEDGPAMLARTGRPAVPLRVRDDLGLVCGLGLTRSALHTGVCTLTGRMLYAKSTPLDPHDSRAVINALAEGAAWAVAEDERTIAVGISTPGIIDGVRVVRRANALGWGEVPLADEVEAQTGLPVVVTNDFHALTAAEHWFGMGRHHESFLTVIIDAVVGAGVVIHDELVVDDGRGGVIAHHLVLPDGPPCAQGHRGCVEGLLIRESMSRQFHEAFGRAIGYDDAVALAAEGDPVALRVVRRAARGLAVLIAELCNVLGLDTVALCGDGVSWVPPVLDELVDQVGGLHGDHEAEITIEVRPWEPAEWGRVAAISGMRNYRFLEPPTPSVRTPQAAPTQLPQGSP